MPGNTEKFRAEIELNSRQAQSELKKLEEQQKRLKEQQKALYASSSAKNHQLAADMQKDIDSVSSKIREQKKYINGLSTSVKDLSQASYKELAQTVRALNKELRSGNVARNSKEYKALADRVKACRTEMQRMNEATREQPSAFGKIADKLNRYQTALAGVAASITGITMTIRNSVQDYAEMDEQMVDVQKYTGMAKDQVVALNEEFKKMNTRTGRDQLNQLAGAAGRLGIGSQKGAKDFVDAADKINVALGDDLGDDAVAQIGKMAMAFGEDDKHGLNKAMLMTGSCINELSQSSSASGGYLVEFAARMAGVAKQAGMTIPQIMSFGSVLDQNMQEVEVSATSLNQLITAMFKEPAKFAQLAGVDVKKFTTMLKTDANQALLQFFATMKGKGGFDKLAPMFDEMGLSGSRAVQVLSVLANKLGDVVTAENTANAAYASGKSVMDEFNRANESAQAQLDKAKKHFKDLSIELGEQLMPVVKYTITGASALVHALAVIVPWLKNNIGMITKLAIVIGSYSVATKIAANWTKIMTVWQARKTILDKAEVAWNKAKTVTIALYTLAVGALQKDTVALTVAQTELNAVTKANPWGLLASVLATVAVGIVSLIGYFSNLSKEEKAAANAANLYNQKKQIMAEIDKQANEDTAEQITKLKQLERIVEDNNLKLEDRQKALTQLKKMVPSYHGTLTREGKLINNNVSALQAYCNNLIAAASAQAAFNKMVALQSRTQNHQTLLKARQGNMQFYQQQMAANGFNDETDQIMGSTFRGQYWIRRRNKNGTISDVEITKKQYEQIKQAQEMVAWNKTRINQEQTIIKNNETISKELEKQVRKNSNLLDSPGKTDIKEPKGGTSTYTDPKKTKAAARAAAKAEREQRQRQRAAEKARKEALKKEVDEVKANYSEQLAIAMAAYSKGDIAYSDYIKTRHDAAVAYYDKLKVIYGANSDDYKKLLDGRAKADQDYQEQLNDIQRQDMERDHLLREESFRKQYYDKTNAMAYQNERLLDENLFQEKIRYIQQQQSLYSAGSKEWHGLELQRTKEEAEHRMQLQEDFEKRLLEYRKEMGKTNLAEQEILEKEGITRMFGVLKETGQMTQEEYYAIIEHIKEKYKDLRAEQNSPAAKRQQGTDALNKAKNRAGVEDSNAGYNSDNPAISSFSAFDAVKQQKAVNEKLTELYNNDEITFAQYQEAKKQLSQETTDKIIAAAQAAFSGISNLMGTASSYAQACSDLETAKISANYQKQIDAAGNNSKKKERLEKKRDKELAKVKTKANKKAMKIEIAQALASTALAAINAYASGSKINVWLGPVAAAMATAAGMMQIATIKKQHQAEEAGYYVGGFTGGKDYHKKAGVVHEGEFVANHEAVNNSKLRPVFSLIDKAQKNNRVASLTADDVTRTLGNGGSAAIAYAPQVNVTTDNSDIAGTLQKTNETLSKLGQAIDDGIDVSMEKFKRAERHWNHLQNNK